VTVGYPGVTLHDAKTGNMVPQSEVQERGKISRGAMSPDGERIVDNLMRIWRRADDKLTLARTITEGRYINDIAWSPDGKQLAVPGSDGGMRLWQVEQQAESLLAQNPDNQRRVAWSPDGQWIAALGGYARLRLWRPDGTAGPAISTPTTRSIAFSPDSSILATVGDDAKVYLRMIDGTPRSTLEGPNAIVYGVAWSPDGGRLASARSGAIHVWNADGAARPTIEKANVFMCLTWSPDGNRIAFGNTSACTHVSDFESAPTNLKLHDFGEVFSIAWRPDGSYLASGGRDATVRFWQPDGKPVAVFRCPMGKVDVVAWRPDGKTLAAVSGGTLQIWNAQTAAPETSTVFLTGDQSATFGPGGELLQGDPEAVERELVYMIEQPDGRIELFTPSQFHQRLNEKLDKS
jgi:WD40 repeat protein